MKLLPSARCVGIVRRPRTGPTGVSWVVNRCPSYTPFPAGGWPPPERGRTARMDDGPAPRRVVRGADPAPLSEGDHEPQQREASAAGAARSAGGAGVARLGGAAAVAVAVAVGTVVASVTVVAGQRVPMP